MLLNTKEEYSNNISPLLDTNNNQKIGWVPRIRIPSLGEARFLIFPGGRYSEDPSYHSYSTRSNCNNSSNSRDGGEVEELFK
jgi:hypothetical protein